MKVNKFFIVGLFVALLLLPLTMNILGINYPAQKNIQEDIHSKVHPNEVGECAWDKVIEPYTGEVKITYAANTSLPAKVNIFIQNPKTGKNFTWLEAIEYNNGKR